MTPGADVWLAYGDSKTYSQGYQPQLLSQMAAAGTPIRIMTWAQNSSTVAIMLARLSADLVSATGLPKFSHVLINLGSNESTAMPVEATFKADLASLLDQMHAAWPNAKIYLMRPWRQATPTECNTLVGWMDTVIAARSAWAFAGPDERVFLEGGDDGATYTADGIHPNAAGYVLTATQWKTTLGY